MRYILLLTATLLAACASQSPENKEGEWYLTAFCPANDRRQEVFVESLVDLTSSGPDRFSGNILNSFGDRGTVNARLKADTVDAEVVWSDGSGFSARLIRQPGTNTYKGVDDMGCRIEASR